MGDTPNQEEKTQDGAEAMGSPDSAPDLGPNTGDAGSVADQTEDADFGTEEESSDDEDNEDDEESASE